MLQRRLKEEKRSAVRGEIACPSYEDMRTQAAILGLVVGEGHHEATIFELARRYSDASDDDAVERAVRDLVGSGLLSIDAGKVVPGRGARGGTETG
jgi:hypothetical protein